VVQMNSIMAFPSILDYDGVVEARYFFFGTCLIVTDSHHQLRY